MSDSEKDTEKEKWSPSTESLAMMRNAVLFNFGFGVGLAALQVLSRVLPIVALIAGGALCALGAGWLLANNAANRKTGAMIAGIGLLLLGSRLRIHPLLPVITVTLLNIITISFLVQGVRSLVNYFIAQRKRY